MKSYQGFLEAFFDISCFLSYNKFCVLSFNHTPNAVKKQKLNKRNGLVHFFTTFQLFALFLPYPLQAVDMSLPCKGTGLFHSSEELDFLHKELVFQVLDPS